MVLVVVALGATQATVVPVASEVGQDATRPVRGLEAVVVAVVVRVTPTMGVEAPETVAVGLVCTAKVQTALLERVLAVEAPLHLEAARVAIPAPRPAVVNLEAAHQPMADRGPRAPCVSSGVAGGPFLAPTLA